MPPKTERVTTSKQRSNLKDLRDRPVEERKKIASQGGIQSGKVRKEKKLMSQIYAEYLEKTHAVATDKGMEQLEGHAHVAQVISRVLDRGDSASVALIKELREGTEGNKLQQSVDLILVKPTFPKSPSRPGDALPAIPVLPEGEDK